ncbi:hypothetical protein F5141DRAFT_87905 [Pisolithus sp. B1]|nr:hypothetical protein F5141DRAFT_87905 [Pisolithus sp. B1]
MKSSMLPVTFPRKQSSGSGHRPCLPSSSETRAQEPASPAPAPTNRHRRTKTRTTSSDKGVRGPGHSMSIAALISPPTSPSPSLATQRRNNVMVTQTNLPFAFPPVDSGVFMQTEDHIVSPGNDCERAKSPERARSPVRVKSPCRARSPIRDGLKCMLSITCIGD